MLPYLRIEMVEHVIEIVMLIGYWLLPSSISQNRFRNMSTELRPNGEDTLQGVQEGRLTSRSHDPGCWSVRPGVRDEMCSSNESSQCYGSWARGVRICG
jgi:hypothetical protein